MFSILSFYSQERYGSSPKSLRKLKETGLQISTININSELEETLKSAFEKYWTFCTVEYVDYKNRNKDNTTLLFANFEVKSWTHYTYTQLTYTNSAWSNFSCFFDNLAVNGVCQGIDNSTEAMKYKVNLAIKNLSAQVKLTESVFESGNAKSYSDWDGFKERLKTTTILIPNEYLSNGLTKNAFKKMGKHEFVSISEINKRLEEDNTKGYSVLNTYVTVNGSYFNIIDLDTGDYIYYDIFGRAFEKGMSGSILRISDKDILRLSEKMYK